MNWFYVGTFLLLLIIGGINLLVGEIRKFTYGIMWVALLSVLALLSLGQ